VATRSRTLRFRCSEDEEAEIKQRAAEQHISVSDLIRQRLNLDSEPKAVREKKNIEAIKREIAVDEISGTTQRYDEWFAERVRYHTNHGKTTPHAERLARAELK
jgi:hypothetical protein